MYKPGGSQLTDSASIQDCVETARGGKHQALDKRRDPVGPGHVDIVEHQNGVSCMGYATFCDRYDDCFARLFQRVIGDLAEPAATDRLREVQHGLCDLVRALDKNRLRYADEQLGHA